MPSNPDELFMPTGMGLFHSTDAGESWEQLTDRFYRIGYPDHLVVSPRDDNELFMSGAGEDPSQWRKTKVAHGTVMRSSDRGRNWSVVDSGLPQDGKVNYEAMSIAAWPGGFALFLGSTDGEVYCSEDGAENWTCIARGLGAVSKGRHYANLIVAAQ